MKKLSWRAIAMALASWFMFAALGSTVNGLTVRASENDNTSKVINETNDTVYDNNNGDKKDVCFYIRGKGVGGDIPAEPGGYPAKDYSDPIRINGIAKSTDTVVGSVSDLNLGKDGFTANNEVTSILDRVPTADEIKSVVSEFNPEIHFVIWYVYKFASTPAPNQDVKIHVDGVIRIKETATEPGEPEKPTPEDPAPEEPAPSDPEEPEKPAPEEPTPEEPKPEEPKPEDPKPVEPVEPEILFSIETMSGNSDFQYDGKEHVLGGYVITLQNLKNPEEKQVSYFGPYGDPTGSEGTMAEEDTGSVAKESTSVTFLGNTYTVNVGGAYVKVKTPGSYTIPFYSGANIVDPKDIVVKDSTGKSVGGEVKFEGNTSSGKVSLRKITIKAGTTVKNDDGSTLTNNEVTISKGSLVKGHKLTDVVFNGSQTGVGSSVNEITSYRIVDGNGNDVTKYYQVTKVNGKLVLVNPNTGENVTEADLSGSNKSQNSQAGKTLGKAGTVTGSSALPKLGAANEVDASPQVWGARRSPTGDDTDILGNIYMILLAVSIMGWAIEVKRKTAEK